MPRLIQGKTKNKDYDVVFNKIHLKYISEKRQIKSGDDFMFFAVNKHKDNNELIEFVEELLANTDGLILPFF